MRVIGGRAKGRKLKLVPGDTTRPIMDRVKENLFNILGDRVRLSRWLDLFGGTGQVGIEALSRGASQVVFLDTARSAIQTIKANLEATQLSEGAQVWHMDAFQYLQTTPDKLFDVIYIAPPQYKGLWRQVMELLDERPLPILAPNGIAIVQIDPKEMETWPLKHFQLYDQRKYGSTLLCFYEQIPLDEESAPS